MRWVVAVEVEVAEVVDAVEAVVAEEEAFEENIDGRGMAARRIRNSERVNSSTLLDWVLARTIWQGVRRDCDCE